MAEQNPPVSFTNPAILAAHLRREIDCPDDDMGYVAVECVTRAEWGVIIKALELVARARVVRVPRKR